MISVDELRAAGALDVPPAWRKTLGGEPDRLQGLLWDDDTPYEEEEPTSPDPDDDESEDEIPWKRGM